MRGKKEPPLVRLLDKTIFDTQTGCWEWTASSTTSGYASFTVPGLARTAHRAAYLLMVGPIPEGLHLDHLCRNRLCVNPDHLEPVTQAENNRRAGAARTRCAKGHVYDVANTYIRSNGARDCRACNRERQQARYALIQIERRTAA
ncbi:HNH endonuclease signature motif containing protein [Streptomyces sp. NPDC002564]|uniref:HNH endonuclease signature motif containing protein n=1 Tax=Streptomyces sp. NPDC002564 TaxID=3364649 RepID=UPI0036AD90A2